MRPHEGLVTALAVLAVLHLRGDKCAIGSRALALLSLTARATCQLQTASSTATSRGDYLISLWGARRLGPTFPGVGVTLGRYCSKQPAAFSAKYRLALANWPIAPCRRSSPDLKSATRKPRVAIVNAGSE